MIITGTTHQLQVTWPRYPKATHPAHFQSSSGIMKAPQKEKVTAAVLETPRCRGNRKDEFLMQTDHTLVPYFPENLDAYAPWVAKHGLTAPYGHCQCGCGELSGLARQSDTERGWRNSHPKRFINGHNTNLRTYPAKEQRFWEKVDKRGPNECWNWTHGRDRGGYGTFGDFKRSGKAHRYSYELHFGPIPPNTDVCHKCDNPSCVNPNHLFLGTRQVNVDDMVAKDRHTRGERSVQARLNESQVKAIRQRISKGEPTSVLAHEFGVSQATICDIKERRSWKHLP